ncbi:hypothetical protein HDU86_003542 [Geranomyces michiganensis]|nr:hypothetical protein HDU86_003542 [Geranomyces michiganensis]
MAPLTIASYLKDVDGSTWEGFKDKVEEALRALHAKQYKTKRGKDSKKAEQLRLAKLLTSRNAYEDAQATLLVKEGIKANHTGFRAQEIVFAAAFAPVTPTKNKRSAEVDIGPVSKKSRTPQGVPSLDTPLTEQCSRDEPASPTRADIKKVRDSLADVLRLKQHHGGLEIRPLVEEMVERLACGQSNYSPKIDHENEGQVNLQACFIALSKALSIGAPKPMCEATGVSHFRAPFFLLLDPGDAMETFDNTQSYDRTRPDVQVRQQETGRLVANVEVKCPWAKWTERVKDLSRVLYSAKHFLDTDGAKFHSNGRCKVSLSMHMNGTVVTVYEVLRWERMYGAIEIAKFSVPIELRAGTVTAVAEAIGWFSAVMARIEKLNRRMMSDIRVRGTPALPN